MNSKAVVKEPYFDKNSNKINPQENLFYPINFNLNTFKNKEENINKSQKINNLANNNYDFNYLIDSLRGLIQLVQELRIQVFLIDILIQIIFLYHYIDCLLSKINSIISKINSIIQKIKYKRLQFLFQFILLSYQMFNFEKHIFIITLVILFWISGLFVLSVIFTQNQNLQDITLFSFICYAIGSFVAGILSDIYGRKPIYLVSSILLAISSIILLINPFYGYIIANLAIGPLNNLTFVYINQLYSQKAELFTIFVLIGWAFSQVTLGLFFYLSNQEIFMYFLLFFTWVYTILSVLYTPETNEFLNKKADNIKQNNQEETQNVQNQQNIKEITQNQNKNFKIQKRIIPLTLKPLIGGSILMFTMQMFYYRTQFTLDNFGISLQINTIVVGLTQICANLIFTKILKSTKRRLVLRILLIFLMGLLVFLICTSELWVQTVVEGFMRLVDTGIMIILGVYIPELFPSNQRGRGTNFIMSFGVIGSALNGKVFSHLPFWSLELFLLTAFLTTLLFKETLKKSQNKQNQVKAIQEQNLQNSLIKQEIQQIQERQFK